jgi:hypothetical protein
VRIKISRTLRSIDNWKNKVDLSRHRYIGLLSILIATMGFAGPLNAIIPLFIVGASINFAFVQAGLFLLVGMLVVKLFFYKVANMFLRVTPPYR